MIISIASVSAADMAIDDSSSQLTDDSSSTIDDSSSELLASSQLTDDSSSTIDNDKLSDKASLKDSTSKSFKDLKQVFSISQKEYNITCDYAYDNETDDDADGILLLNRYCTINGNNHIISGSGLSKIFRCLDSNISIKNLVLRDSTNALSLDNTTLASKNLTFESNVGLYGSAVYLKSSTYDGVGDRFTNNYGTLDSPIYAVDSYLYLDKCVLMNEMPMKWGLVKGSDFTLMEISNTTFANTTSRYATAVFNDYKTTFLNCNFINLFANATGGAVGIKQSEMVLLDNCQFVNVSSSKNGGALFIDINGVDISNGSVRISNTLFKDCFSEFGAAVLQLGGYLEILNSTFVDNVAGYNGGAVYASNTSLYVSDSLFENNTADFYDNEFCSGGAIYVDDGIFEIEKSSFTNNHAGIGDGIYIYDCGYGIVNNSFKGNGEAIHAVFTNEGSYQRNNRFNKDTICLNDTNYDTYVSGKGKEIILNPTIINASITDSRFDLRDYNLVTSVKNQGFMGACWAFGATSAFESAFLKATGVTLDISENNIQNSALKYSIYGLKVTQEGGFSQQAPAYFLSWLGALPSEDDDYDELGKVSPIIFDPDSYHLQDAIMIQARNPSNKTQSLEVENQIKQALIDYGALTVFLDGANGGMEPYYNSATNSQYFNETKGGNHFVAVVGWDDTYSKDNFIITPPGDGAWICKNSWGEEWGENGFYYVSYYDTSFATSETVGYIFNNTDLYDTLYQYDVSHWGFSIVPDGIYAYLNDFDAEDDEFISAVGTYFREAGINYTARIYVNDVWVYEQTGSSEYPGYHTIKLDNLISISKGDEFAVEMVSDSIPLLLNSRQHFIDGSSMVDDGSGYESLGDDAAVSLKAYAVLRNIGINKTEYKKGEAIVFKTEKPNETVVFELTGTNITVVSNSKGEAILKLPLADGNHNLTAYYKNSTIIKSIHVANRIDTIIQCKNMNTVAVYSGDGRIGKYFTVSLKDAKGNALSDKRIQIGFNGAVYNRTTNETGGARLQVNLANAGLYTFAIAFLGDDDYNGAFAVAKITVTKQTPKIAASSKSYKASAKTKTLTATFKSANGNPIKGKKITFTLNGKTYTGTTNAKGVATVKVSISKKGTYAFTVKYAGDNTFKAVTAKGKLTIK